MYNETIMDLIAPHLWLALIFLAAVPLAKAEDPEIRWSPASGAFLYHDADGTDYFTFFGQVPANTCSVSVDTGPIAVDEDGDFAVSLPVTQLFSHQTVQMTCGKGPPQSTELWYEQSRSCPFRSMSQQAPEDEAALDPAPVTTCPYSDLIPVCPYHQLSPPPDVLAMQGESSDTARLPASPWWDTGWKPLAPGREVASTADAPTAPALQEQTALPAAPALQIEVGAGPTWVLFQRTGFSDVIATELGINLQADYSWAEPWHATIDALVAAVPLNDSGTADTPRILQGTADLGYQLTTVSGLAVLPVVGLDYITFVGNTDSAFHNLYGVYLGMRTRWQISARSSIGFTARLGSYNGDHDVPVFSNLGAQLGLRYDWRWTGYWAFYSQLSYLNEGFSYVDSSGISGSARLGLTELQLGASF
jgi:hypothetical protein